MNNLPIEQRPNRLFETAKRRGEQIRDGKIRRDRAEADLMKIALDADISEVLAKQIISSGLTEGINAKRDDQ